MCSKFPTLHVIVKLWVSNKFLLNVEVSDYPLCQILVLDQKCMNHPIFGIKDCWIRAYNYQKTLHKVTPVILVSLSINFDAILGLFVQINYMQLYQISCIDYVVCLIF